MYQAFTVLASQEPPSVVEVFLVGTPTTYSGRIYHGPSLLHRLVYPATSTNHPGNTKLSRWVLGWMLNVGSLIMKWVLMKVHKKVMCTPLCLILDVKTLTKAQQESHNMHGFYQGWSTSLPACSNKGSCGWFLP